MGVVEGTKGLFKCEITLITIRRQSRHSLRSNEAPLLVPPSTKYRPTLANRAFQSATPGLCFCNELPPAIRNIKTLDAFKLWH